jgi:WD40 repeat protein
LLTRPRSRESGQATRGLLGDARGGWSVGNDTRAEPARARVGGVCHAPPAGPLGPTPAHLRRTASTGGGPYASRVSLVAAWDARTGITTEIASPGGGDAVAARDGRWIATWSWRHARIHDTAEPDAPPRELALPDRDGGVEEIHHVELSPGGELVAMGTAGFHLALWDTTTWEVRRVINLNGDSVCAMAFSPDGRTLAAATSYASEVELRDVATGARVGVLDAHTDDARAVAFSPDGATVVTGAADGTLRLWDPHTARLRATLS